MADLEIPKGSYGRRIDFTVTDEDGNAENLTGYTITVKAWKQGDPSTLLLNDECTINVAANGTCYYTVADGDFPTQGMYQIALTLSKTGEITKTKNYTLEVKEAA